MLEHIPKILLGPISQSLLVLELENELNNDRNVPTLLGKALRDNAVLKELYLGKISPQSTTYHLLSASGTRNFLGYSHLWITDPEIILFSKVLLEAKRTRMKKNQCGIKCSSAATSKAAERMIESAVTKCCDIIYFRPTWAHHPASSSSLSMHNATLNTIGAYVFNKK